MRLLFVDIGRTEHVSPVLGDMLPKAIFKDSVSLSEADDLAKALPRFPQRPVCEAVHTE